MSDAQAAVRDLGFRGEIAELYHRYRHGYPPAVIDAVVAALGLGAHDVAVDLGCGTGQLTLTLARRLRAVVGVDPEADMLVRARRAARDDGVPNVAWMIGTDGDVPALVELLGERSVGAVTVGQALHWMDHRALFGAVGGLVRPGGGIAVVTNGTPLWLQDNDWSRALKAFLEDWLGSKSSSACGTDEDSQQRYGTAMQAAGFELSRAAVDYAVELDLNQLVGGVYSALGVAQLPAPGERPAFAERVRQALAPHERFSEHVRVTVLIGRAR